MHNPPLVPVVDLVKMIMVYLKKHKSMALASIFFFYLGCGITLSFLRMDCVDAGTSLIQDFDSNPLDRIEYAVLILTSPDNEEKRDAIRATWANFGNNLFMENGERLYKWNHTWIGKRSTQDFVKHFFVVGTEGLDALKIINLENENNRNNDLLLLDSFHDSYKNLAIKVLHSMRWLKNNLRNMKYLIKCDDDSFVRVDLIIRDLEAFAPSMDAPEISQFVSRKGNLPSYTGLYWGYFDGRARVYLNGKWQERDWFLCDNYLPYALGGGYVISQNIVDYISRNYDILSHYQSEDVSMGVWTAALAAINRVHDIRFDTEWRSRGCTPAMLVRHKQTPKDMFEMYRILVHSQGERLCKVDNLKMKSYVYNWNVLPSQCCRSR